MAFADMFKTFSTKYVKDEEIDKIPSYQFCMYLGTNIMTIQPANQINKYDKIPMINQFYMMRHALKDRKVYCKFLKNDKSFTKMNFLIMHFYKVSPDKSQEYKEMLSESELSHLEEIYKDKSLSGNLGFSDKLVKSLIK